MSKREELEKEEPTTNKCDLVLCGQSDENQWFVDSGCLRHMTGGQNKFISLNKKDGNVSFGSASAKISRKGTSALVNGKGKLQNVLMVEGLLVIP